LNFKFIKLTGMKVRQIIRELKAEGIDIEFNIFDGNLKKIIPEGETPLVVMKNFEIEHPPKSTSLECLPVIFLI